MSSSSPPSLQLHFQPITTSHYCVSGEVLIEPGAGIAPGVLLQADPGCRVVVRTGVCIGLGTVIHAHGGEIELAEGVSLGPEVLLVGALSIGARACIGAGSTIMNQAIAALQMVPPGSLLMASQTVSPETSAPRPAPAGFAASVPPSPAPPAPAPPAEVSSQSASSPPISPPSAAPHPAFNSPGSAYFRSGFSSAQTAPAPATSAQAPSATSSSDHSFQTTSAQTVTSPEPTNAAAHVAQAAPTVSDPGPGAGFGTSETFYSAASAQRAQAAAIPPPVAQSTFQYPQPPEPQVHSTFQYPQPPASQVHSPFQYPQPPEPQIQSTFQDPQSQFFMPPPPQVSPVPVAHPGVLAVQHANNQTVAGKAYVDRMLGRMFPHHLNTSNPAANGQGGDDSINPVIS